MKHNNCHPFSFSPLSSPRPPAAMEVKSGGQHIYEKRREKQKGYLKYWFLGHDLDKSTVRIKELHALTLPRGFQCIYIYIYILKLQYKKHRVEHYSFFHSISFLPSTAAPPIHSACTLLLTCSSLSSCPMILFLPLQLQFDLSISKGLTYIFKPLLNLILPFSGLIN